MSWYDGLSFFFFFGAALVPAVILGILQKPIRLYGLALSALTIGLIFSSDARQTVYLVIYLVWSVGLIYIYDHERSAKGRKPAVFYAAVLLALIPLVLCKISPLISVNVFGFTGISYLTFRVLQILIETYDGVICRPRLLPTLGFLVFFPSFSSGPIDRSRRFTRDWDSILPRDEYLDQAAEGFFFLLLGAAGKFIVSALAYRMMGYLDVPEAQLLQRIGYAYAYSLYLYSDFAGYSAMAVGTGLILGVRLPQNFHFPFLAKDIKDFWDRWHISLSHWFRDFVFTRFVIFSTRKKLFHDRMGRAVAGFMVNMCLMGAWHGLSLHFLLYGVYHGLLLSLTEVYQKKSRFFKNNKGKTWYRILSWFVTMQLVVFGLYLFSGKLL